MADDIDDDTVLSALLPIDRTVVSGGGMPVDEQTILTGPGGELDEKTRAVERRALNTAGGVSDGARVAFVPAESRERYPVRTGRAVLPTVTRFDVARSPARAPLRPRKRRDGTLVLVAAILATAVAAAVVAVVVILVLGQ